MLNRAVEEFSLESDVTPEQIVCHSHGDVLWDRKFDYDWQRLLHWSVPIASSCRSHRTGPSLR